MLNNTPVVCLRYAAVDVVIQPLSGKADEEAIPRLGGRRRRSDAAPGHPRRRQLIVQTDH
jgi:hypothetical protein